MESQAHSIQELRLDFVLTGRLAREGKPVALSAGMEARLVASIEAELDRLCPGEEVIFLDRLVLNTSVDWADFEAEFPAVVQAALREALLVQHPSPIVELLGDSSTPHRASASEARLMALQHYLRHGSFPWWFQHGPGERASSLIATVWKESAPALMEWLATQRHDLSLMQRLAHQAAPAEMRLILSRLAPGIDPVHFQWLDRLATALAAQMGSFGVEQWLPKVYAIYTAQLGSAGYSPRPPAPMMVETLRTLQHAVGSLPLMAIQEAFPELPGVRGWFPENPPPLSTPTAPPPLLRERIRSVVHYYLQHSSLPPWASDLSLAALASYLGHLLGASQQDYAALLERMAALPQESRVVTEALQVFLMEELAKRQPLTLIQRIQAMPGALRAQPHISDLLDRYMGLTRELVLLDAARAKGVVEGRDYFWSLPATLQPFAALHLQPQGKPWDLEQVKPMLQMALGMVEAALPSLGWTQQDGLGPEPQDAVLSTLRWFLRHGSLPAWSSTWTASKLLESLVAALAPLHSQLEEALPQGLAQPQSRTWIVRAYAALLAQELNAGRFQYILDRLGALPVALRRHTALAPLLGGVGAVSKGLLLAPEWPASPGASWPQRMLQDLPDALKPLLALLVEGGNAPERVALLASLLERLSMEEMGMGPGASSLSLHVPGAMSLPLEMQPGMASTPAQWVTWLAQGDLAPLYRAMAQASMARPGDGLEWSYPGAYYEVLARLVEWMRVIHVLEGQAGLRERFWQLPLALQPVAALYIQQDGQAVPEEALWLALATALHLYGPPRRASIALDSPENVVHDVVGTQLRTAQLPDILQHWQEHGRLPGWAGPMTLGEAQAAWATVYSATAAPFPETPTPVPPTGGEQDLASSIAAIRWYLETRSLPGGMGEMPSPDWPLPMLVEHVGDPDMAWQEVIHLAMRQGFAPAALEKALRAHFKRLVMERRPLRLLYVIADFPMELRQQPAFWPLFAFYTELAQALRQSMASSPATVSLPASLEPVVALVAAPSGSLPDAPDLQTALDDAEMAHAASLPSPASEQPAAPVRGRSPRQTREQGLLLWYLENGSFPPWAPALTAQELVALVADEILGESPRVRSRLELALAKDQHLEVVVPGLVQALARWALQRDVERLARWIASFPGHVRRKASLMPVFRLFEAVVEWLHDLESGTDGVVPNDLPPALPALLVAMEADGVDAALPGFIGEVQAALQQRGVPNALLEPAESDTAVATRRAVTLPTTYYVDLVRYYLLRGEWPWWGPPTQVKAAIAFHRLAKAAAEAGAEVPMEDAAPVPLPVAVEAGSPQQDFLEVLSFVETEFQASLWRALERLLQEPGLRAKLLEHAPLAVVTSLARMALRPLLPDAPGWISTALAAVQADFPVQVALPALIHSILASLVTAWLQRRLESEAHVVYGALELVGQTTGLRSTDLLRRLPAAVQPATEVVEQVLNLEKQEVRLAQVVPSLSGSLSMPSVRGQMRHFFQHGHPVSVAVAVHGETWQAVVTAAVEAQDIPLLEHWFGPPLGRSLLRRLFPPPLVVAVLGFLPGTAGDDMATSPQLIEVRTQLPDPEETALRTLAQFIADGQLPRWSLFPSAAALQAALTEHHHPGIVARLARILGEETLEQATATLMVLAQLPRPERPASVDSPLAAAMSPLPGPDDMETLQADAGMTMAPETTPTEGSDMRVSPEEDVYAELVEYTITADGEVEALPPTLAPSALSIEESPWPEEELLPSPPLAEESPLPVEEEAVLPPGSPLEGDPDVVAEQVQTPSELATALLNALRHDGELLQRFENKVFMDWMAEEERNRQREELNRLRAQELGRNLAGDQQGIAVHNAGLVILWPFFTRLFRRLELMEATTWVDAAAQARAVFVLQYMVNFQEWNAHEEPSEHLLMLNKVLCGLPIETVVTLNSPLTTVEKENGELVLKAAMQNWKAMAKTSVQGFQNSFLFREGFLSQRGDHWNLKVEQRGYDPILKQLDWGISTIKLPYNAYFVYTEWI